MEFALSNALGEITLVLFTTLSPSGVIACLIAAMPLLSYKISEQERYSLTKAFSIPLVVASAGLIMSATHLGNPANALYVIAGIGRSPLSNEVVAAAAFLVCAGTFWLAMFSEKPHVKLMRVWYCALVITGMLFIGFIGAAYHVETIPTWHLPTVPLSIWLNSLLGGPIIGLVTLGMSKWRPASERAAVAAIVVSSVALVANVIVYFVQGQLASGMANSIVSVVELVPHYWAALTVFTLMAAAGIAISSRNLTVSRPAMCISAATLVLCAIFIMRFHFYMMHLTVGLAV